MPKGPVDGGCIASITGEKKHQNQGQFYGADALTYAAAAPTPVGASPLAKNPKHPHVPLNTPAHRNQARPYNITPDA